MKKVLLIEQFMPNVSLVPLLNLFYIMEHWKMVIHHLLCSKINKLLSQWKKGNSINLKTSMVIMQINQLVFHRQLQYLTTFMLKTNLFLKPENIVDKTKKIGIQSDIPKMTSSTTG